jgi:hypothetical protein
MTVQSWLDAALADAEARGLADLRPLLQDLAEATTLLRRADWNEDAAEDRSQNPASPGRRAPDASDDEHP